MSKPDAAEYRPLLDNLTRFTVRSALYVRTAELGEPTFDVAAAASAVGLKRVGELLRSRTLQSVDELIDDGLRLLDVPLPAGLLELCGESQCGPSGAMLSYLASLSMRLRAMPR